MQNSRERIYLFLLISNGNIRAHIFTGEVSSLTTINDQNVQLHKKKSLRVGPIIRQCSDLFSKKKQRYVIWFVCVFFRNYLRKVYQDHGLEP